MNKIKFWLNNARPTSLPQSILPALTAVAVAHTMPDFSWWLSLLAVVGVAFAHLGINLFDDYFDYKKKKQDYREELVHEGIRARIGKCPYLVSGEATLKQLLIACCVFCGIALIFGAVIFYFRRDNVLFISLLTLLTAILGVQYSAPPLRLSYHGFGEILIGVIFGLMNMIGTYFAACGDFDTKIVLLAFPIGLLVMNIVYIHSILDFFPDKKIGKQTLAVILNNQKAMLAVLFFVIFLPFLIIICGVIYEFLLPKYLFVLLTLPMAISLFYMMIEFVRNPERQFAPKFWLGPFNQWKLIVEHKIEWFMIRWLTARNLISFFCLIIIILTFV
jgi:1,4-dihydroxy-2-naphthoate octaprenyltransferase